jgi:archaemetzincin
VIRAGLLLFVVATCSDAAAPTPAPPAAAEREPPTPPRLGSASPGEWRAAHPEETAMSFDDYVASGPVRAEGERRVLAFLPVGDFDGLRRAAFDAAVEFSGLWFDLPVRTLPAAPLTDDAEQFRERPSGRQYRTRWFLNETLPNALPDDAVVLLGVTPADIYPGRDWNFVFGEADLRRRVGVYSLARYFPEFVGKPPSAEADRLALLRTLKVVVHETGHAFGLEHCADFACAMNGSNSMTETDGQPLVLCPTCLNKLAWNRGFDVAARRRRLAAFLDAHGLPAEAAWYRAPAVR